jgi:uncharacterized RDD family membrane protein YckC
MDWYYVEGGKSAGPVSEEQLVELTRSGKVAPDTLVWREGLGEWKLCREAGLKVFEASVPGTAPGAPTQPCVQCGNFFPQDEMMRFENSWVCVNCKPIFLQKLKEGVKTDNAFVYGGFWIRFGAKFIDGILLQIVNYAVIIPLAGLAGGGDSAVVFGLAWLLQIILGFVINIGYQVYFLGKYGATPGKMACRLKIVNPDGSPITYWKAFGRFWGEMLSSFTLLIGYLIAAWDQEKRSLHDRVCNTRVIRTS